MRNVSELLPVDALAVPLRWVELCRAGTVRLRRGAAGAGAVESQANLRAK
jgi:hypothetical protein